MFCRVRPVIKEDGEGAPAESIVSYDRDDDALVNILYKGRPQVFEMDQVFSDKSSQEQVKDFFSLLISYQIKIYILIIKHSLKLNYMLGQAEKNKMFPVRVCKKNRLS